MQVADEHFAQFPVLVDIFWVRQLQLFLGTLSPVYLGRSLMVSVNNSSTAYSEVNSTLAATFSFLQYSLEPW